MSICLLQEPLDLMLVAPSITRRTIRETEIWRASQRSSNAVDGGGTASCCGDFDSARVYLVDAPRNSIRQQTELERRMSFTLARLDSK
jgi:hypothetical protein